jgi:DNA polymerase-4
MSWFSRFAEAKGKQTFDSDTIGLNFLYTESIAYQLRSQNWLTGCISVKIRHSDFQTQQMQSSIPYASAPLYGKNK